MSVTKLIKNRIEEELNIKEKDAQTNYTNLLNEDIFTKNMEIIKN